MTSPGPLGRKPLPIGKRQKMTVCFAIILHVNNLKMKSPIEIVSVMLILLLIAGTWIFYRNPVDRKVKITINSMPARLAEKKSAFTIHKP